MWQTKYASAVPKNLGLGLNFRPCSEGHFLSGCPLSVVKTIDIRVYPFFMHNILFTTDVLSSSSLSASQLGSRQASRQTICYLQPYWEMQISSTTGTFSYWHKIKRWTMSILSNHFPILYPLHSKKGLFIIECWFSLDSKKTTRLFDINGYQIWSCFVR